ncbi:MAG: diguanylate cyclase [Chloroflexi bacterium]|nr:diguanylate cyclase [Chloroflexota bacterium]
MVDDENLVLTPISQTKPTRILVGDDDSSTRVILKGILKKWGYEPVLANDGLEVWEILQQPDSPQLVILDWMMPGLTGLEVVRRAREMLLDHPPFIIILSGLDDRKDVISGLDSGANDYVKKPFDFGELYARIRVGERSLALQNDLYQTQQQLEHLASHDPLTGVYSRRAILDQLSRELSRTRRENDTEGSSQLCVSFFDIDHFKGINDRYGHQAGDEILQAVVRILPLQLRKYDSLGRIGGDEFLILTPGTTIEKGRPFFERLITAISSKPIATCVGEVSITLSMGVIQVGVEEKEDLILDRADAAMYRAKQAGRNQVHFGSTPPDKLT